MFTISDIKKKYKTKVIYSVDKNPFNGRRVYPFASVSLSHEYDVLAFMTTDEVEITNFRAVGCTYYSKHCGTPVSSAKIPGGIVIYRKGLI